MYDHNFLRVFQETRHQELLREAQQHRLLKQAQAGRQNRWASTWISAIFSQIGGWMKTQEQTAMGAVEVCV